MFHSVIHPTNIYWAPTVCQSRDTDMRRTDKELFSPPGFSLSLRQAPLLWTAAGHWGLGRLGDRERGRRLRRRLPGDAENQLRPRYSYKAGGRLSVSDAVVSPSLGLRFLFCNMGVMMCVSGSSGHQINTGTHKAANFLELLRCQALSEGQLLHPLINPKNNIDLLMRKHERRS